MKNTISKLTERITLQKINENISKTTESMFLDVFETRACITPLYADNLYEIIILKPPIKFNKTNFSGIKWNNIEYNCVSILSEYNGKFLKGTISKLELLKTI